MQQRTLEGRKPTIKAYEVSIYGLLINSEDHDKYTFIEISFYTRLKPDLAAIFAEIEDNGYYLLRPRDSDKDRVVIADRAVEIAANNVDLVANWREFLVEQLGGLNFTSVTQQRHKRTRIKQKYESRAERMRRAYFEK